MDTDVEMGAEGRPAYAPRTILIGGVGGALLAAVLCLAGLAGVWIVANLVPIGHAQDAIALRDFTQLQRPLLDGPAGALLSLLDPLPFVLWSALLVALALCGGRTRLAGAIALVALLAPLTSELLKPLVAHSHDAALAHWYIPAASWPSGHSTAAMTLALSAVLVAPSRLRGLVAALGGLFAITVGFSVLLLGWHMPSDVFGGFLVAALWTSLAVASLRALERRRPVRRVTRERSRRRSRIAAPDLGRLVSSGPARRFAGLLALGMAGALAVLVDRHGQALATLDHRALMAVAVGIASLAGMILATLATGLRR